ncbi:MAG: ATP-binding protein [bacterium]
MLSIPGIKGLVKSLEHKKDAAGTAPTSLAEPEAPQSDEALGLAKLAVYLDLDVLALIRTADGGRSAEMVAAGRCGLASELTLPSLEGKGTLARLIAKGRPQGGSGRIFVTSEVFPRDANWCDFLPLDSTHAFFFMPLAALPAPYGRRRAGDFVLAADLGAPEADIVLDLKARLAASLISSGEPANPGMGDPQPAENGLAGPLTDFLLSQGYRCYLAGPGRETSAVGSQRTTEPDRETQATIGQSIAALEDVRAGGQPNQTCLETPNGLRAFAYPIQAGQASPIYLVIAKRQGKREDEIIRAEWLKLLGRFTSSIAHEIKNPLTGIAAGVQYLAKRTQPGVTEADTVSFILTEIARLDRIVDDLYKIARPPQLVLKPTSINQVIAKSVFCLSEDIARKRLRLEQRLTEDPQAFEADAERLQQVMINIIKNAVEASPEGGLLEIAASVDEARLTVRVKDSGPGVSAAESDRIFEPFYSTKKGGTGLGLCISQAILEEHGGRLLVESPPGGGACFVMELPLNR